MKFFIIDFLEFLVFLKFFYELYFGCKVGDQDKNWAPHICCLTCVKRLTDWVKGSRHMYFAIPMVWREPQDHSSDCYFCITQIKGISSKSKHTIKYPNLPSAMRPVPHSEDLPIPHLPTHLTLGDESEHEAATEVPKRRKMMLLLKQLHLPVNLICYVNAN